MFRAIYVGFFLAMRTLRRGQKGLIITPMLVMVVTYINLLFIPGIIHGAILANKQKLQQTLVADYSIQPTAGEDNINDVPRKLAAIQKVDSVEAVTSVLQVGNRITVGDEGGYWTVLAVDPESYQSVFKNTIQAGLFVNEGDTPSISLGSRITGSKTDADSLKLGDDAVGSSVGVLLYEKGNYTYSVSGVINNSFYDADVRAFISRASYEKLVPASAGAATKIFIKARGGTLPADSLAGVQKIIGTAEIRSTEATSSSFEEQAGTYSDIGQVIGSMAILVAAIVIFIVTYVDLLQRRRQIGIQRAIGIRSSAIITSYVIRAAISTLFGVLVGAFLYRFTLVAYFNKHPLELRNGEVSLATTSEQYIGYALFLMAVALLAALLPALKEVRLKLLDAIWRSS